MSVSIDKGIQRDGDKEYEIGTGYPDLCNYQYISFSVFTEADIEFTTYLTPALKNYRSFVTQKLQFTS